MEKSSTAPLNRKRIVSLTAFLIVMLCLPLQSKAERVTLYYEDGFGGIGRTTGTVSRKNGQYCVDVVLYSYGGHLTTQLMKVERVRDSAHLMYEQESWAGKYKYAAKSNSCIYYFNMRSVWIPSPTDNLNDPHRVWPVRTMWVYYSDGGSKSSMKTVLIKCDGQYLLYFGDDMFAARIESNADPIDYEPAWTRRYRYRAAISGFTVYFNFR